MTLIPSASLYRGTMQPDPDPESEEAARRCADWYAAEAYREFFRTEIRPKRDARLRDMAERIRKVGERRPVRSSK